jgi:hypothetical protein
MAALILALFRGYLSQRKDKDSFIYISGLDPILKGIMSRELCENENITKGA